MRPPPKTGVIALVSRSPGLSPSHPILCKQSSSGRHSFEEILRTSALQRSSAGNDCARVKLQQRCNHSVTIYDNLSYLCVCPWALHKGTRRPWHAMFFARVHRFPLFSPTSVNVGQRSFRHNQYQFQKCLLTSEFHSGHEPACSVRSLRDGAASAHGRQRGPWESDHS